MFQLAAPATFRFREKASVFLAELHPAGDAAARSAVLARLRKRDFDATHHCVAWREGVPVHAQGSDDDGEPAGTAGPPMLRVLEGAELTDLVAVCIRWFGGTKLGTGGLVKAYTEAVQGALQEARQAGLLREVRILRTGVLAVAAAQAHLPFAVLAAAALMLVPGASGLAPAAGVLLFSPIALARAVREPRLVLLAGVAALAGLLL